MKIAVMCASGFGDALIFHSLTHTLQKHGADAITLSDHIPQFGKWVNLSPVDPPFDAIVLQHDNSQKAFQTKKLSIPIYSFYGAYSPAKHGPLNETYDYVCNRNLPMVENVRLACFKFFGYKMMDHGFSPPPHLIHRKYKRRIVIHETGKNRLPKEKFLKIATHLEKLGYEPVFLPLFPTLEELASFLYESGAFLGNDSGPGHLASLLQIPHLIIGGDGRHMPLWQPGWYKGFLLTPPSWAMKFKLLRINWSKFISTKSVINNFKTNILETNLY